jgi:nucleoside-diphosphate-sugar epimerase
MSQLTLVTGAGGFIGGQLVRELLAKGVPVRAVDKKSFTIGISSRRRPRM